MLDAFHSARGDDGGEIVFQALFSYASDDEAAFENVRKWKGAQPTEYYREDWHTPREMYEHVEEVISDDHLRDQLLIGSDPEAHIEGIRELLELRPTVIVLQNNSPDPHAAIEFYGEHVLPALRSVRV